MKLSDVPRKILIMAGAFTTVALLWVAVGLCAPVKQIGTRERCPVCGMFVAKYPNWVTQVHWSDGARYFDGVKDMMAWIFHPDQYNGIAQDSIKEIWVRDYYTLDWIDGRTAFFVMGSDTYGPMGHELIPFASRAAAENFLKDHHGRRILAFSEITADLIESLRHGMKMR